MILLPQFSLTIILSSHYPNCLLFITPTGHARLILKKFAMVGFELLAGMVQKQLISPQISHYSPYEIEVLLAHGVQLPHGKTQSQLLGNVVIQAVFQISPSPPAFSSPCTTHRD